MTYHVLYNPHAGNGRGQTAARALTGVLPDDTLRFWDLTELCDLDTFFDGLPQADAVILAGGDGTLNRFLNDMVRLPLTRDLYYFATGSGNDFFTDIGHQKGDAPCLLNPYLTDLPTVEVNGQTHRFLNGVDYGINGYCCQEGDRLRQLSVMVYHCPGKLRALSVFPSIFKGEHVRHTDMVEILTGRDIQVEFDRPTPLQIDGETILGVTSYRAVCAEPAVRGEAYAETVSQACQMAGVSAGTV